MNFFSLTSFDNIEQNLSEKLNQRNYKFRNKFYNINRLAYYETLTNIITYKKDKDKIVFNSLEVEYLLRFYGNAVIGECIDGVYRLLGYVTVVSNFNNIHVNYLYTKKDITFTIPKKLRLKEYTQLTENNLTGNFVILLNRPFLFNNFSDFDIIDTYVTKLSEIELSRFSIIQQSRVNTFFKGEADDEDVMQLVSSFYNGDPFITVTDNLDPEEMIIQVNGFNAISALKELKNESNTVRNEINEYFGIDTAGVSKESGVSQSEINSNNDYLASRLLLYLDSRNTPLKLLENYKGVKCIAISNPQSEKMITPIAEFNKKKDGGTE